jgi:hypothetical protein
MILIHLDRIEHACDSSKLAINSTRPENGCLPSVACRRSECTEILASIELRGMTSLV